MPPPPIRAITDFHADLIMKSALSQSEIWSIAAESFHTDAYRTDYADALDFVLRDKDLSILDTAGGTGFPTIDLYERGYRNITVTDGDEIFARTLQERFSKQQLRITAAHSPWQELASRIKQKFDAVINADNSLVYIDGWLGGEVAEGKDAVIARLRVGLENFLAVTKQGGLTVIGLGKHYVPTFTHSVRDFNSSKDGENYEIKWQAQYDWNRRVMEWTTTVTSESFEGQFSRKSYLVTKEELVGLMNLVGFKRVHVLEPDSARDNLIIGVR